MGKKLKSKQNIINIIKKNPDKIGVKNKLKAAADYVIDKKELFFD